MIIIYFQSLQKKEIFSLHLMQRDELKDCHVHFVTMKNLYNYSIKKNMQK